MATNQFENCGRVSPCAGNANAFPKLQHSLSRSAAKSCNVSGPVPLFHKLSCRWNILVPTFLHHMDWAEQATSSGEKSKETPNIRRHLSMSCLKQKGSLQGNIICRLCSHRTIVSSGTKALSRGARCPSCNQHPWRNIAWRQVDEAKSLCVSQNSCMLPRRMLTFKQEAPAVTYKLANHIHL